MEDVESQNKKKRNNSIWSIWLLVYVVLLLSIIPAMYYLPLALYTNYIFLITAFSPLFIAYNDLTIRRIKQMENIKAQNKKKVSRKMIVGVLIYMLLVLLSTLSISHLHLYFKGYPVVFPVFVFSYVVLIMFPVLYDLYDKYKFEKKRYKN